MSAKMTWVLMAGLGLIVGLSMGCNKPQAEEPIVQAPEPEAPPFPESTVPSAEVQPTRPVVTTTPPPPPPPPVETAAPPVDTGTPDAAARKAAPAPKEQYASRKASSSGRTHTVKKGETLQTISQKYYGTTKNWRKIYDANRKQLPKGPDEVMVGTKLRIP
ncbi:MAG: LysM peptidoglycan-binding domain-containing protein [Phycisphaerae bacterium]|nr:LysM peptidoglycan-binding domain-containing protein [Phycisphaerae bacterium]